MIRQIQKRLKIGHGVIRPLSSHAAIEMEPRLAPLQPPLDGQHHVRVILLHRHPLHMGQRRYLRQRIEIPQQQLRLHPRPPAGGVSAIGGDHIVLRTGPFLQPVKISCAENIARHVRHLCSFVSSSGS